jgi:hypothetical protein
MWLGMEFWSEMQLIFKYYQKKSPIAYLSILQLYFNNAPLL